MSTIFTKIIKGEIPSYKIIEDELFYSFLDINPVSKGHVLVVPKTEVDVFFELSDEYLSKILLFSKRISKALESTFECDRVALSVIGLEVPHAHLHLIPISKMQDASFEKAKLKFSSEEFEKIASQIRGNII